MKYSIHINQLVLSTTDLDVIDGAILDYLHDYIASENPKILSQKLADEDGAWTWINFQTLLEDMPILRIKDKSALSRRIKKIEASGYIECKRDELHRKLYVRKTRKFKELLFKNNSTPTTVVTEQQLEARAVVTEQQYYGSKTTNYSTNDNSTIDKSTIEVDQTLTSSNVNKKEIMARPEENPKQTYSTMDYLTNIPDSDIILFMKKYPNLTEEIIRNQAQSALKWLHKKGITRVNYKTWMRDVILARTAKNIGDSRSGGLTEV